MLKLYNKYCLIFIQFTLILATSTKSQVIHNRGAVISIHNGTVVSTDSIINTSSSVLQNNGAINMISINNSGIVQGSGYYGIKNLFTNTGTFTANNSTVNYEGNQAQTIAALNYHHLIISNARTTHNITYSNTSNIGIAGSFNPNATFTSGSNIITSTSFDFNGSAAQTIPSFTFEHVNFSGGSTKTLVGNLTLKNSMAIGANTTLALSNYNITLQSNASSTARVATSDLTAAITYGTGRFISERYIPGRRKYRLLTSPVTTSELTTLSAGQESLSIWGNWQNSGNNTPHLGTIITGGTSADGFDQHTSTPSVYFYQDTGHRYVAYSSLHGKNTKYTPLKAGVAYYFFVYGDRTNSVSTSTPNYTTLKATGKILLGDQSYTINSSMPLTNIVGDYTFLGNPFASPIDWTTLPKTNLENTYWGWDPNLSATGGYVTVNSSGGVTLIAPFSGSVGLNQYIQSGQGFFVRTAAPNPTLTIREIDKVSNYNANAFRGLNDVPLIAMNLFYVNNGEKVLADGAVVALDASFDNAIGKEDATKFLTSNEGVAIKNSNTILSIDGRNNINLNDSINLNTYRLSKPQYSWQIFFQNFESQNLQPFLEDKFLNSSIALSTSDTNWISFNINRNDANSTHISRFNIVFKPKTTLSGTLIDLKATKVYNNVNIKWNVNKDEDVNKYQVLKSTDGIHFNTIGEVKSKGSNSDLQYQFVDENPVSGMNYYQIKTITLNSIIQLSKVVSIHFEEQIGSISIYPNPMIGKSFNINLSNFDEGIYNINISNAAGKLIERKTINHSTLNSVYTITINTTLSSGAYLVTISNKQLQLSKRLIVN